MAENDRRANAELFERSVDQNGLRLRRPNCGARALAVAEAWSVEGNDPVSFRGHVDEPARLEILDHAAIAMQQHQRLTLAPFDVVQTNAVDFDEPAGGRIVAFRLLGALAIVNGRRGQDADCGYCG